MRNIKTADDIWTGTEAEVTKSLMKLLERSIVIGGAST